MNLIGLAIVKRENMLFPSLMVERLLIRMCVVLFVVLLSSSEAMACPGCRTEARTQIINSGFIGIALLLMLPLIVIIAVGILFHLSDRPSTEAHVDHVSHD